MGWGVVVKWGVGDGEGWVRGGGIGGEGSWIGVYIGGKERKG